MECSAYHPDRKGLFPLRKGSPLFVLQNWNSNLKVFALYVWLLKKRQP